MGIASVAYLRFSWMSRLFLKMDRNLAKKLTAANIRLYYEVYASIVGMFTVLSLIVAVPLALVLFYFVGSMGLLALIVPLIVFVLGLIYPSFKASNRAFNLESEVP